MACEQKDVGSYLYYSVNRVILSFKNVISPELDHLIYDVDDHKHSTSTCVDITGSTENNPNTRFLAHQSITRTHSV